MSRGHQLVRVQIVPVTCVADGQEHLVTDEQMAAGLVSRTGRYMTLCGHPVWAAFMVCPPGQSCLSCAATLPRHAVVGGSRHRRSRRGLFGRLSFQRLVPTLIGKRRGRHEPSCFAGSQWDAARPVVVHRVTVHGTIGLAKGVRCGAWRRLNDEFQRERLVLGQRPGEAWAESCSVRWKQVT